MSENTITAEHTGPTGRYDEPLKGTEDWVHVATLDAGHGYDWDEVRFYYSPSARRFFYGHGAGCSCNSWEDDFTSAADFENGTRSDALAAVRRYADEMDSLPAGDALDVAAAIRTFKTAAKKKGA